jgi:PAS domain S-box-containing protein
MSTLDEPTLRAIVESSHDAIATKTLDGVVTSWNPSAERMFGYRADEVIGRSITMLFPPDRLHEEAAFQRRIHAGERVEHFETVRLRKDGVPLIVDVTLSPIRDATGRIVGISKVARDITPQKEAESRLRAQEKLLRITLASVGDAVIATDEHGHVTFMNGVAEHITGWTADDAVGCLLDHVFVIVNEHTGRSVESPVTRALRDGTIVGLANHTVVIARDGTRRPVDDSAAPIHDETGRVFGAVLVFRDISERRRTEQGLQRLAAIVESSDDAIVSKTLDGVITSWNHGAEQIFGYRASEVIGRPITILFSPDRLGEERELLARIARGERVDHFETVRIRKDGVAIHVSVSLSPIRNEAGEVTGVSKIARDISERVQLLARESSARREAEEASRIKDQFLATLSHELRTPLTSIFGWTRMLRSGELDAETTARALDVIERNCRAQMDLITDLLDVSRIIVGQMTLRTTRLSVDRVVRAAVETIRPAAMAKNIDLDLSCEPAPPVLGDPDRLQQVAWNLLSNAVKFTPSGGRVTVKVSAAPSTVNVVVSDTGIGIDADLLPYIFDRFRQADSSTTRVHGGLGLGLAIVRHLVELHGGVVHAASEGAGRGATFTVSLPAASVSAPDRHPAIGVAEEQPTPTRLDRLRVLVVDDDPDARDLVAEVLRRSGGVVVTAASTAEALATIGADRPQILVADIGMPGEDGYVLVRRLRQLDDRELASIPALALTAYAQATDRDRALAAGFQAYIAKPVDPVALVRAAAALARGRAAT